MDSCFFFFSSRRRHTRLTCDWSSDVCSSDLLYFFGDNSNGTLWTLQPNAARDGVQAGSRKQIGKLAGDRKSTRLNSSHMSISYAVFCLKKKKTDLRTYAVR